MSKCRRCGRCCTKEFFGWVDIEPIDIKKWIEYGIWDEIKGNLSMTTENKTGYLIDIDIANEGGRCPFLDVDNLCWIHKKYGYAMKPLNCQKFLCSKRTIKNIERR